MNRVPEREPMDDPREIEAYDILSRKHLELVEVLFVRRVQFLLKKKPDTPLILDIGIGPGHIPVRLSAKNPSARFIAVDISLQGLLKARENITNAGLEKKILLVCADAKNLPFRDGTFAFGYSHSTFHHLVDPQQAIEELIRVLRKKSGFIIRDLRRPPAFLLEWYVRIFGYYFNTLMKRMYRASLIAGFSFGEIRNICGKITAADCSPRRFFVTHVGIEGEKR